MNNVPASLEEMDRAIRQARREGHPDLHQRQTAGRSTSRSSSRSFERMAKQVRAAGLGASVAHREVRRLPDRGEVQVRDLVAVRLALRDQRLHGAAWCSSGMLDRLPKLRIITHQSRRDGAVLRQTAIGYGMDQLGRPAPRIRGLRVAAEEMAKRPVDYFRMFYGDTSVNGARSAIRCDIDFYGTKRVLFGTDCPFDPAGRAALHPRDDSRRWTVSS